MKRSLIILAFCLIGLSLQAQFEKPRLQWFNAGISTGVSNVHVSFLPSIDLACRGTTLRVLPLLPVMSIGVTQNILPMDKNKQVGFWVASFYYNRYNGDYKFGPLSILDQDKFTILTGLKMFFAKRVYAHLQVGAAVIGNRPTQNLLVTETGFSGGWKLSAELDLGINLWTHYNNPE